ncbi:hypothetical protein [uncultured Aliiroseovarius sp.]|uniref:hypothetical protein n=1 Tax=uncultured Aliiroseovarius sp. TaxID=1658783 RepID=UPI0026130083|nr:hypothetical protein [uncultured Aliiroseovarius sp.]
MSRRRPPLKVAPSPAAQRDETKQVEKIVESSRALQERMKKSADSHGTAKPTNAVLDEKPSAPKPRSKPKSKTVEQSTPKPADQAPTAHEPEAKPKTASPSRRMSICVPINLTMRNRAGEIAKKLDKDADYVINAYLKRTKQGLFERWKSGQLEDLASDANLLLDQQADKGTRQHRIDATLEEALSDDIRSLMDDPLDLVTINKKAAAFFGAEMLAQLTKE